MFDELVAFIADFCDTHTETVRVPDKRAIGTILTSPLFPSDVHRQAVLYGFVLGIGADAAPGITTSWLPTPPP